MVHKKKYDVVTTFPNYDLHGAAAAGNIGLVTYAITHGQPINAVLGGLLPLHAAASGGSVEVIQYLIDHGADVNAPRMPSSTGPPIGVGGAGGIVGPAGVVGGSGVGGLGGSGGDGDSTAEKHRGRLGSAGGLGHHHHHLHHNHHASPTSSSGPTRPGSSTNHNNNNGASAIPIGRRGSTPLHFAAAMGHIDVVKLLLENGAKPSAKDADKNTPEAVARAAGRARVAEFLKEWEAGGGMHQPHQGGVGTPRRSLETPLSNPTAGSKPNPDFKFGPTTTMENESTTSLPLVTSAPPAALSTSSLGRYPNGPGRRPSLPSIYESPPSTRGIGAGTSNKRQDSEPVKPSTAGGTGWGGGSTSKLPFSIRRPKSAGNKEGKDGGGKEDDTSSMTSHFSSKTQASNTIGGTASRLNRIFKRPNLRPATASGALSTTSSPTSPSPPNVIARSRSPSASKVPSSSSTPAVVDFKDKEKDRSGGFFHVPHLPHLPHLPRRDYHHHHHAYQHQQNPHHLHLHHVSRDAISGPIINGQSPSTSIPDIAHPEMADPSSNSPLPLPNNNNGDNTPSDEIDEEEAMSRALNLSPSELQYARSRGVLPDRFESHNNNGSNSRLKSRTAPPGQTSFGPTGTGVVAGGLGKKSSHSTLNHYPSYTGLSTKASYSTMPSPNMVPRHRANLGPGAVSTMTSAPATGVDEEFGMGNRSRTDTPLSFGSTAMERSTVTTMGMNKLSPSVRIAHPVPSLTSLNRQVRNMRVREQNGSISSLDSALTGTSGSNELSRSPLGGEDLPGVEYPPRSLKMSGGSTNLSPIPSPLSLPSVGGGAEYGPSVVGLLPLSDGRVISSRAEASELVEAHKKAIQSSHEQRVRARRMMSGGASYRGHASPLAETSPTDFTTATPTTATTTATAGDGPDSTNNGNENGSSPNVDTEDESLEEEDITSLREKLAALGESVQIERTFAKREQQARRWNRESGLEEGSVEESFGTATGTVGGIGIGPASMGVSTLARSEMLDGYLRQGGPSDSEKVKRATTPKRDVFGRPVTPKKEGRPPTPKDTRPTTPKNIPLTPISSRLQDAPRENRVLPPASRTPPVRSATTHLTLQQTRAISKSDLALNSHINRDADLSGRERAWTTTDVRPRIGPTSASRPSTAGSKLGGPSGNGGLTIDIIQTMPTPTDGGATPLRGHSPMTPLMPSSKERQEQETIQSRRRVASNPLRIDAQVAQERSLSKESTEDGPRPSPNTSTDPARRQRSNSKPRRAAAPAKGEPSSILLHRITTTPPVAPPAIALVPPSDTPFSSFLSVSSGAQDSAPDSPMQMAPVPALPSAVSLHNMHVMRAREEAMKVAADPQAGRQASPSPPTVTPHNEPMGMQLTAGERRLGLGAAARNGYGYESVRSFNEEQRPAGEGSWKLWTTDSKDSDMSAAKSTRTKLGGFLSRLKR